MQVYFVKSTYNGNAYKISDFYNSGGTYLQNANKTLDINLIVNDGETNFITRYLNLPDETSIRDYTHIIVPSFNKIYEISSITYLNVSQWKINLTEDPFIGNYQTINTTDIIITRTNDTDLTFYQGFNDLVDVSNDFSTYVNNVADLGTGSLLGDWLLIYVQNLTRTQKVMFEHFRFNLNTGRSWLPFNRYNFDSEEELLAVYPNKFVLSEEISKDSIPFYYGNYVDIDGELFEYILNGAVDSDFVEFKWTPVNKDYKFSNDNGWESSTETYPHGVVFPSSFVNGSNFFRSDQNKMYVGFSVQGVDYWNLQFTVDGSGLISNIPIYPINNQTYFSTNNGKVNTFYSGQWVIDDTLYVKNSMPWHILNKEINVFPNQPVIIFALPFNSRVGTTDSEDKSFLNASSFRSLEWYDGTKYSAMNILSTKIINGAFLFKETEEKLSAVPYDNLANSPILRMVKDVIPKATATYDIAGTSESKWMVGVIDSQVTEFDISSKVQISSILDYEPFKEYELWVYGQRYQVPAIYINSLYMKQNINTNGINYVIYRDEACTKTYITGSVSMDAQWSADQLSIYSMNNPTYKDEFNNSQAQKWWSSIAGGLSGIASGAALGGISASLLPGDMSGASGALLGTASGSAGALSGIVSTAIQTHFDKKQFELMQKGKELAPDMLYGDTSSTYQYFNMRKGIYWIIKTNNNSTQMLTEYNRKGYPTMFNGTISSTTGEVNELYDSNVTKLISGYLLKTITNNFVTNEINKKMTQGVALIE